ncbi:hypothetical protein [Aquisalimonas sp.]|uniref:hypothetical protein n=1 Tax=Aquisalimonas sp. TaxID=1872621 RepID=UPI0025C4E8B3|nr:hypothetical protein [Aquisalimonas sp.]
MDDKRLPEEPVKESRARSKSTAAANQPRSWSRRRFGVAAVSTSVIMSLHAQPLRAGGNCSPSGWTSGNSSLHPEPESCGGETPEYWREAAYGDYDGWPSPYEPGDGIYEEYESTLEDDSTVQDDGTLQDDNEFEDEGDFYALSDEGDVYGDDEFDAFSSPENLGTPFWSVDAFSGGEFGGLGYWNEEEQRSMSLFEVLNDEEYVGDDMGRHAVAALFNAAAMKIPLTVLEVQEMFNAALRGEPYINDHLSEPMSPEQVLEFFKSTYDGNQTWESWQA